MKGDSASRLVARLESEFRAARVAKDELAADDLAFSLAQDVSLADELVVSGGSVCVGDLEIPIDAVGDDYVAGGDWLIPLAHARVVLGQQLPRREANVFLGKVRRLARSGAFLAVGTRGGEVSGRITKCAPDHLCLAVGPRRVAIPLEQISYVRRARGGSRDVP